MTWFSVSTLVLISIVLLASVCSHDTAFSFWDRTPFSRIDELRRTISAFNCHSKSKPSLRLPRGSVSQLPAFNTLPLTVIHPNRTGLLHLHNMAMNRAFFYSYILQAFNSSDQDFKHLPGLLYTYLSAVSDVSANPTSINSSVLMYDINTFYPNWLMTLGFNKTLDLFAVRALRVDDTFLTDNFNRQPTLNTIIVYDIGAQSNYTQPQYKSAPWYGVSPDDPNFIPDRQTHETLGGKKHLFILNVQWTSTHKTGETFFGPPYPGQLESQDLPVRFSQPWFDCGPNQRALNEWSVSAVSPIVDFMPRYGSSLHLRRPQYVAVAAMDTYFLNIPVNVCPIAEGNPKPNFLAGSDRCKATTVCEPSMIPSAVQFRSMAFQCRCKPGFRFPPSHSVFSGSVMSRSTAREFHSGFHCSPISNLRTWPTLDGLQFHRPRATSLSFPRRRRNFAHDLRLSSPRPKALRRPGILRHLTKFLFPARRSKRATPRRSTVFSERRFDATRSVFRHVSSVTAQTCHRFAPDSLILPGNVGFGADRQFFNKAATALRLAHFLSAFLQLGRAGMVSGLRVGQRLHERHIIGEALANVAGDISLLASGVHFARDRFVDSAGVRRDFFGPLVYRKGELASGSFEARDLAKFGEGYHEQAWFKTVKLRWGSNTKGLQRLRVGMFVRAEAQKRTQIKFPFFPMTFLAPRMQDGYWSAPYFDCEGPLKRWVITYSVPFFGRVGSRVEFFGVVTASVPLASLDVNQCSGRFYDANFFKNTALCDSLSTFCQPIRGYGFSWGNYECRCRNGFEFPFMGQRYFFLGSLVEREFTKAKRGDRNIFSLLKCRPSSGRMVTPSLLLFVASVIRFVNSVGFL